MSKEFLVEIGIEELPSRHAEGIESQLTPDVLESKAAGVGLKFDGLELFITPRRLVFTAKNIEMLRATEQVRIPKDVAMQDGKLTTVGEKFVKDKGVSMDHYGTERKGDKEFLVFTKKTSVEIERLIEIFIESSVLVSLNFDRPMRWAGSSKVFSRPIRSLLALHGTKALDISIFGVKSGKETQPPRYLNDKAAIVASSADYFKTLKKWGVEIDQNKRRKTVEDFLKKQSATYKTKSNLNGLISEIVYLTESPLPIICEFEEEFLKLPAEVIEAVLIKHQRYIPLYSKKTGKLTNKFIVVANQVKATPEIKYGNEKVVRARLADGLFFFNQDQKYDLDYFNKQIKTLTFQENLGSMADKSDRLTKIVKNLADHISFSEKTVLEAAKYAKADLSTTLVSEFSSLEGVVGRIYALRDGHNEKIANLIEDYYHPRSSGDILPVSDDGKVLALADKMDTLYGLYSIGMKPKGNSDPYGLRRSAIAIARILWSSDLEITLDDLINSVAKVHKKSAEKAEIQSFIIDRLEQEVKVEYEKSDVKLMRAVVQNSNPILSQKRAILQEASKLEQNKKFADFMEFAKRVYNISIKQNLDKTAKLDVTKMNPSEKALYKFVSGFKKGASLEDLLVITQIGNEFFTKNMIMSENKAEREIRLSLLVETYKLIGEYINLDVYLQKVA